MSGLEFTTGAMFFTMLGIVAFECVFPWNSRQWKARVFVHAPLLILPMGLLYEILMPPHMNIRVDLLILWPVAVLGLVLYLVKLWLFQAKTTEAPSPPPQAPPARRNDP